MTVSAATVWEVRTAGSDTLCSGGFVAGASGTDYSQQNAAQYTGTNLVIDGAVNTKVTSATHNFVAADVGNILQITAGSGFTTGFFEIVSVAANAATLDRSVGTVGSTAGTFAVGGALKSPAVAAGAGTNQNTIWVKSGTYTISSGSSNVANGVVTLGTRMLIRGYSTSRGDDAARPVLQASGIATVVMVTMNNEGCGAWNVEVDGAGLTSTRGFSMVATDATCYLCVGRNCTNTAFFNSGMCQTIRCYATACTTQPAFNGRNFMYCEANANTSGGFLAVQNQGIYGCLAYGNTTYGFNLPGPCVALGCTAYNNSTVGFLSNSPYDIVLVNCLAYGNGTYGFDNGAAGVTLHYTMLNCAAGANTTADRNGTPAALQDSSFITLTADPFTNKAGGDFSLNTTTGGGAALRALGIPGLLPGATTTSYLDIGAVQHADPASGGGTGPNVIVSSGAGSRGGSW